MNVHVKEYGTGRNIQLTAEQAGLFLRELAQAKKHLPSGKKGLVEVAPDCLITVQGGAHKGEYELYARAVLRERKTGKIWQFYFGLLILEWLYPVS
jgi:hypothetical protein